jgi:hypothetical protein
MAPRTELPPPCVVELAPHAPVRDAKRAMLASTVERITRGWPQPGVLLCWA